MSHLLDDIIKLVDSDPEVGFYITKYILSNDEKIQSFLDKHELEPVLSLQSDCAKTALISIVISIIFFILDYSL